VDGAPTLAGNTWPGEARVTDSSREATEVAIRAVRIESRTNFAVRLYDEYVYCGVAHLVFVARHWPLERIHRLLTALGYGCF
jgi:hypothetical protein